MRDESRVELSASGSTVEIVSIPVPFYADKYGALDQLFLPLLTCAQRASDLMGIRIHGDPSALHAAAYMAGELLRDTSFSPLRRLAISTASLYVVDFLKDRFQVESSVFSPGKDTAAKLRVRIEGKIRGDKFQVFDPVTNNRLFSFTKFEADKLDFFVREFPFLANESRKDPTLFTEGPTALSQGVIDLVLGVPVRGATAMVRVQKGANSVSAYVKSTATGATIMELPLASLNNLAKLTETIGEYLSANPSVSQSLEDASPSSEDASPSSGTAGGASPDSAPACAPTSTT